MRNKTVVILTCLRSCYCSSPGSADGFPCLRKYAASSTSSSPPSVVQSRCSAEQTSELLAGTAVAVV